MHSGEIVQEMQDLAVAIVPPYELLQVKMDTSKWQKGMNRSVS